MTEGMRIKIWFQFMHGPLLINRIKNWISFPKNYCRPGYGVGPEKVQLEHRQLADGLNTLVGGRYIYNKIII